MQKTALSILTIGLALMTGGRTTAQSPAPAGSAATDVPATEIQAALKKTAAAPVSDQQLRVVSIGGQYNVGIGVLHRAKTDGRTGSGALTHSRITEVYQIISGNGTLVTGGALENPKPSAADGEIVKVLAGPSTSGSAIRNGVSRKVGPGDMVVIPPNTPHGFSEITSDQIVYTVVRMDPQKVLPAGYVLK